MADCQSYNVLYEPWIPVETNEGEIESLGILETLARAHLLRGICTSSCLVSYGIQRMLIAFLIDALRPADIDELAEIIALDYFDQSKINTYVKQCCENGERFDLFDAVHPFMQTVFYGDLPVIDLAVKLFTEWPEGNNHIHFNHVKEDNHYFTPAECAQALCTLPAFAMNFGRSASFGINGTTPIYFLYAGKSLFSTLALSMVSQDAHPSVLLDDPPVAWRSDLDIPVGMAISRVSLLHGLTCQPRRVQLLPQDIDGEVYIRQMRYEKGWDYKAITNWTDPHVSYTWDEKGERRTLKPRNGRAVWRDLGSIMTKNSQPIFLNRLEDKLGAQDDAYLFPALHAFALLGKFKGAVYAAMGWFEEAIPLHIQLIKNEEKTQFIIRCLGVMEDVNRALGKTMVQSLRQLNGDTNTNKVHGRYVQLVDQCQSSFFELTRQYVIGEMLDMLESAQTSINWEIPIKLEIGLRFRSFAIDVFTGMCEHFATSAKALEWKAVAENVLRHRLYHCLKGGWINERANPDTDRKKT